MVSVQEVCILFIAYSFAVSKSIHLQVTEAVPNITTLLVNGNNAPTVVGTSHTMNTTEFERHDSMAAEVLDEEKFYWLQ